MPLPALAVPLVMAAGGVASLAYGFVSGKKKDGAPQGSAAAPLAPGETPGTTVVNAMPPELLTGVNAMLQYGKNPDDMEMMAGQLDTYGYADLASKLRARAAELRSAAQQQVAPPPPPPPAPPTLPVAPSAAELQAKLDGLQAPVTVQQTAVVTATSGINVRSTPSASGTKVGALAFGAQVNVLAWDAAPSDSAAPQGWAKISGGGVTGFATKEWLRLSGAGIPNLVPVTPTASAVLTASVTAASGINVRATPSATGTKLGAVATKATVTVLDWNAAPADSAAPKGWAKINGAGVTGFATKEWLSLNGPAPAAVSGIEEVFAVGSDGNTTTRPARCVAPSGCRLRRGPSPTAPFLTFVGNGEKVTIMKQLAGPKAERLSPGGGGWSLVRYKTLTGWVPSEWLL